EREEARPHEREHAERGETGSAGGGERVPADAGQHRGEKGEEESPGQREARQAEHGEQMQVAVSHHRDHAHERAGRERGAKARAATSVRTRGADARPSPVARPASTATPTRIPVSSPNSGYPAQACSASTRARSTARGRLASRLSRSRHRKITGSHTRQAIRFG